MIWRWWLTGIFFLGFAIIFTYLFREDSWETLTIIIVAIESIIGAFFTVGAILYHTNRKIRNWLKQT